MIVDFGDIKKLVNPIIDYFDHSFILANDAPPRLLAALRTLASKYVRLEDAPAATAECIVAEIGRMVTQGIKTKPEFANISSVDLVLWETPTSKVEWSRVV